MVSKRRVYKLYGFYYEKNSLLRISLFPEKKFAAQKWHEDERNVDGEEESNRVCARK